MQAAWPKAYSNTPPSERGHEDALGQPVTFSPQTKAAASNPETRVRAIRGHGGAGGAHPKTIKKIAGDTGIY
jgi:hypothetical protein